LLFENIVMLVIDHYIAYQFTATCAPVRCRRAVAISKIMTP